MSSMNQDQDQEKLANAAATAINNTISAGFSIASMFKPGVKISVSTVNSTAQTDLAKTRQLIQEGKSLRDVENYLSKNSQVVANFLSKGKDPSSYTNSIIRGAMTKNELAKNDAPSKSVQVDKQINLER